MVEERSSKMLVFVFVGWVAVADASASSRDWGEWMRWTLWRASLSSASLDWLKVSRLERTVPLYLLVVDP